MRIGTGLLAAVLAVALHGGCLEHVRRPGQADALPRPAAAPQEGSVLDGGGPASRATDLAVVTSSGTATDRHSGEARLDAGARERIRQVNEYAYWCIQQSMWNEARSHLERALESDSLAASLHNNLAIVYEHLGQADSAATLYRRAQALAARPDRYAVNLRRLERSQDAPVDTAALDLFDLKGRLPGPQQPPY